jgi:hypothetical protein
MFGVADAESKGEVGLSTLSGAENTRPGPLVPRATELVHVQAGSGVAFVIICRGRRGRRDRYLHGRWRWQHSHVGTATRTGIGWRGCDVWNEHRTKGDIGVGTKRCMVR